MRSGAAQGLKSGFLGVAVLEAVPRSWAVPLPRFPVWAEM